jgi:hypothetical protein
VPREAVGWLTAVALAAAVGLGELLAAGGAADEHPAASTASPASPIAAAARITPNPVTAPVQ